MHLELGFCSILLKIANNRLPKKLLRNKSIRDRTYWICSGHQAPWNYSEGPSYPSDLKCKQNIGIICKLGSKPVIDDAVQHPMCSFSRLRASS